jgi:two-component system chemotaxis response regulator CheY
MKILIVDDSKAMRMIVHRNLRLAGFGEATVVEACDGAEALDVASAESPDLIVSDWNMPVKSGFELLLQLRAAGNTTQFGFITSESTDEMRQQAFAAGADFFVVKPFTPETFRAAVSSAV